MTTNMLKTYEFPDDLKQLLQHGRFAFALENLPKTIKELAMLFQSEDNGPKDFYDKLTTEDKIRYDLLISYSIASLFWSYLKTKGHDSNSHLVKSLKGELGRIQQYIKKAKVSFERKSRLRRLDIPATNRLIRGALWQPSNKTALKDTENDECKLSGH